MTLVEPHIYAYIRNVIPSSYQPKCSEETKGIRAILCLFLLLEPSELLLWSQAVKPQLATAGVPANISRCSVPLGVTKLSLVQVEKLLEVFKDAVLHRGTLDR